LPYDTPSQIHARLVAVNSVFGAIDRVEAASWGPFGAEGAVLPDPLTSPIDNFYMTDAISRASKTMAACTATFVGCAHKRSGTHG
jgi:NADH-quinone oxidoreductase subunit G